MTPVKPADLDLMIIRDHVKIGHPTKSVRGEDGKLIKLPDLARAHATWHAQMTSGTGKTSGLPHKHGGDMKSVKITDGLFAIHPEGWFTGRHLNERN